MLVPPGFVDEDDAMAEEFDNQETVQLGEELIDLEGVTFVVSDAPGAMGDMPAVADKPDDFMDVATAGGVQEDEEAMVDDVEDANLGDGDTVQVL